MCVFLNLSDGSTARSMDVSFVLRLDPVVSYHSSFSTEEGQHVQ